MSQKTPRIADLIGRTEFVTRFVTRFVRKSVGLAFIVSVCILSLCALIPGRAGAQAKPAHPLKQDETCLACQGQAGRISAKGKSISIDPSEHGGQRHGILGCTDRHATIKDFLHPDKIPQV